jgi:hypothetical protein
VQIRFTDAAAKHGVGKAAARFVMANTTPRATKTKRGDDAWRYIGRDEQGRELEVIAVEVEDWVKHDPYLLVIHLQVTPSGKRR